MIVTRSPLYSLLMILTLSLLTGCGKTSDGPALETVMGSVTLDGEPLPDASILFKDPARKNKSYFASVKAGAYTTEMQVGQWTVEITARRRSKDKMVDNAEGTGKELAMEQYLPAEYNEKSTLEINVTPDGENQFQFDLKSK